MTNPHKEFPMSRFILFCFIVIFGFFVAKANGPSKSSVKSIAEEMAEATIQGDFGRVVDYTYSPALKKAPPRKEMIKLIEDTFKRMKDNGFLLTKYEVGDPGRFHTQGDNTFVIIPATAEMKFSAGKIITNSYLLGISSDSGKSWKFVDGQGLADTNGRDSVLPPMPATLTLPIVGKPKIIKDE